MSQTKRSEAPNQEQGQPSKKQQRSENSGLLEEGHVYIFYRAKVGAQEAESMEDVKRLYLITVSDYVKHEAGRNKVPAGRIFAVPKKRLPDVDQHDRFAWFVEDVFDTLDEVKGYVKEEHYSTKTRGERTNPKATLVAAGVYGFVTHEGHSHFVFSLDESSDEQVNNIWPEFNIRPTASFVLQVKAPGVGGPPNAPSQDADFPQDLRDKFQDYRWISIDTTRFLDFPRCQMLLVGAKQDIEKEFGSTGAQLEQQEEQEFPGDAEKTRKQTLSELSLKPSDMQFGPLYGEFD